MNAVEFRLFKRAANIPGLDRLLAMLNRGKGALVRPAVSSPVGVFDAAKLRGLEQASRVEAAAANAFENAKLKPFMPPKAAELSSEEYDYLKALGIPAGAGVIGGMLASPEHKLRGATIGAGLGIGSSLLQRYLLGQPVIPDEWKEKLELSDKLNKIKKFFQPRAKKAAEEPVKRKVKKPEPEEEEPEEEPEQGSKLAPILAAALGGAGSGAFFSPENDRMTGALAGAGMGGGGAALLGGLTDTEDSGASRLAGILGGGAGLGLGGMYMPGWRFGNPLAPKPPIAAAPPPAPKAPPAVLSEDDVLQLPGEQAPAGELS